MALSWFKKVKQFKSPLAIVAGFLLRSRDTLAKKVKAKNQEIQELKKEIEQKDRTLCEQRQQMEEDALKNAHLKIENQQLRQQSPILPEDPPLPHHTYGPKMISLCVNLTRRIGLRATPDVLKIVFDWLGADVELPEWTTVRTWALRVGVAAIQRPIEEADDWIWMADHSNQIGQEKALAILGVRASKLPEPGQSLAHSDVRVLALKPGVKWRTEDMQESYKQLAQRCGNPMAVLVDGAPELREGAKVLQESRKDMLILGDFKHFAANVLKKTVGTDDCFAQFTTQLGRTRSAIQQTELAHFTPPASKSKARFMNLAPTVRWARMTLWHLSHPDSEARGEISPERMKDKLGWLEEYRDDLDCWGACQDVISACLTFINEQGVFSGASRELHDHLRYLRSTEALSCPRGSLARRVTASLLRFVRESESKLVPGQRLPLSTEILESSFGLFKQLEKQHSKGGFTSLLAAYGCLLHASTAESIRRDFAQVSVKQMREWVSANLGKTVPSKRRTAYQEFRSAA